MGFEGQQPERWLVRLLITRDPETEGEPREWDWEDLMGGGDPVVLNAERVGYQTTEEPCSPESSCSESS